MIDALFWYPGLVAWDLDRVRRGFDARNRSSRSVSLDAWRLTMRSTLIHFEVSGDALTTDHAALLSQATRSIP